MIYLITSDGKPKRECHRRCELNAIFSTSLAQGLYCLDTISQDGDSSVLFVVCTAIDLIEYRHSSVVKLSGL